MLGFDGLPALLLLLCVVLLLALDWWLNVYRMTRRETRPPNGQNELSQPEH